MTQINTGGYKYFKTRIINAVNIKTGDVQYAVQASTAPRKWSYVIKDETLMLHETKAGAIAACRDMKSRNDAMIAAREGKP